MIRVGIVAGEASGDLLGSDLISTCKAVIPDIQFEGIGGPSMASAGCNILYPAEKLAVMGLIEVAGRYFELATIRKKLIRHFLSSPPDIFIGIDAPDFNLTVEQELKSSGIKTVHYVGPTVWAWRSGRLKKIKKAVDLMLVLFPFEVPVYQDYHINVKWVGHPAVDRLQSVTDKTGLKQQMGIEPDNKVIAIMPGSRKTEIDKTLPIQMDVVNRMHSLNPKVVFISSVLNQYAMDKMDECLKKQTARPANIKFKIFKDRSAEVLSVADAGLLTSGTITLEAMLHQLPMVVMYKMNWLSFMIIRSMVKIDYASLPNLLAGKEIVPEFIQENCQPEKMVPEILGLLNKDARQAQIGEFRKISSQLKQDDPSLAARAILDLI